MIILNNTESYIFNLLRIVAKEMAPEDTVLRVAGGWVRDKILGLDSHDIDVAVNNMSGAQFASLVYKWLEQHDDHQHSKVSIVTARPEQSKHLETAILKIHGVEIDFANLRKESYSESRIPVIEPGTPEEDARRRDLTINALFYNIMTEDIEDLTDKGLSDIKHGICRTPIDALTTFIDDPLRVLRTVRFAAKFNFQLDQDIINAARSPQVHGAFVGKISRERIWAEMVGTETPTGWKHGFLTGPNPPYAISLLHEIGFRDLLFRPKGNDELIPWDTDQNSAHHDLNIWDHTVASFKYLFVDSLKNGISPRFKEEDYAVRNLAMLLHDIGKCDLCFRQEKEDGTYSYIKHEVGSARHAETVLEQLSAPSEIKERVVRLVGEHMRLHTLPEKPTDKSLRKFIKDLGNDWEHSVDIAIADAYGKKSAARDPSIREVYENYRTRIQQLLLQQGGNTTPKRPISGHDIMKEFSLKSGPLIGAFFKQLDERLLDDPQMTSEEAMAFAKDYFEGNLDRAQEFL